MPFPSQPTSATPDIKEANFHVMDALAALGYPAPPADHPAANMWMATLRGGDVAVEAPPMVHVATALPPALAKLACNPLLRLLVLAPAAAIPRLEEELVTRGQAVGVVTVGPQSAKERWPAEAHCVVGDPVALRVSLDGKNLQTMLLNNLMLVLLWADEIVQSEHPDLGNLEHVLTLLPRPQHISLVVSRWSQQVGQLASAVLFQPTVGSLWPPEGMPPSANMLEDSVLPAGPATASPEGMPPAANMLEDSVPPAGPATASDANGSSVINKRGAVVVWDGRSDSFRVRSGHKKGNKQLEQCSVKHFGTREQARRVADALCEMANAGASKQELSDRKKAFLSGELDASDQSNLNTPVTRPSVVNASTAVGAALSAADKEHASMIAKYIANIVCRSSNTEFRDAVLQLLPTPRKRKPVEHDQDPSTSQGTSTFQETGQEELQKDAVQDAIATLLASTAQYASKHGSSRKQHCADQPYDWFSDTDNSETD